MTTRRKLLKGAVAGAGIASLPSFAIAQGWPNRPIRMVIPWPPGQATDLAGRVIAQRLQERLGQPVVPENRAGAGGTIGSDVVAKAAPDGYTYGVVVSSHTINKAVRSNLPFDPVTDFEPGRFARVFFVLRHRAERGELENGVIFTNGGAPFNHRVRTDAGARADLHMRANHRIRPHAHAAVQLGFGVDDGGGVNQAHTGSFRG